MSVHAIDILLRAKDQASKTIKGVNGELGKTGSIGSKAGRGIRTAAIGLAALGGVAAAGIAVGIKTGLRDLATLETAVTSVDGAIKTMGLTGQVTGTQIAGWANEIESDIGAAFDDKDITASTATLIRYGKVAQANLRPAMVVMTDLAAKTGSVESASTLLAKALAAPEKAAGKLARQGIILTKAQQKQIEAFVKAGKIGAAQKVVLDAVAKSTKGAAEASQGPYQRALSTLSDVSEDARKALAEGFLPVIERVAGKLSKIIADPKAIQSIRDFGGGLADAFDEGVKIAEGIDWGAMVAGLRSAAGWAKGLIGAFSSLPPEAKGLILGLAGLTKLTGGAPIKIAVDFAKDALSGVFGHFFDRGSSPANPLFVSGGIGAGGAPGGAAGGALGGAASLISKAVIVGAVAEIANVAQPVITQAGVDIHDAVVDAFKIDVKLPIPKPSELEWPFGPKNTPTILPDIFGGNGVLGGTGAAPSGTGGGTWDHGTATGLDKVRTSISLLQHGAVDAVGDTTTAVNTSKDAVVAASSTADRNITGGVRTAGNLNANATAGGASRVTTQSIGNASRIVGAIAANRAIVNTSVVVNVSGSTVTSSQTSQSRTGSGGGSQGNDSYGDGGHGK